ncbi:MAG: rhomboid family intramembrane serine protease, partial [Bacteroidota bacterium]|nr:rhomboid family intramembrane serine protease [Bacteroidota bacterium]
MSYQRFRPTSQNRMPPGVLNLIILNCILFVVKIISASSPVDLDNLLSLHHPFDPDFHFFQYITSMFMHGSFTHILFNMFGLWIFGAMVE